jgi:hypothetical protein
MRAGAKEKQRVTGGQRQRMDTELQGSIHYAAGNRQGPKLGVGQQHRGRQSGNYNGGKTGI